MKKALMVILSLLLLLQCNIAAFAANSVVVSADKVSISQNEPTLIPIKIESNSGIMGFKITVEYPVEVLDVKSVSRGEITAKGNFNTNFGINDGRFDVLWNNVDEIKTDGTLFLISVLAKTEIKEDTEIKLTFSQPDTFNEKYEDVVFECKNIAISAAYIEPTDVEGTNENNTAKAPTPIDNSQVLDAVKITLEKFGYESLKDVANTSEFITEFNKNLETITGSDEHNVTSFDTIKSMYNSAYEGVFITETTGNIDTYIIQATVNETLDELNAKSIEELNDKEKTSFVQRVEEKLRVQNPDTPSISADLETDKALDIIEKLYSLTNPQPTQQQDGQSNNTNVALVIAVIAVVLVVLIVIAVIIIKKKKPLKKIDESL